MNFINQSPRDGAGSYIHLWAWLPCFHVLPTLDIFDSSALANQVNTGLFFLKKKKFLYLAVLSLHFVLRLSLVVVSRGCPLL